MFTDYEVFSSVLTTRTVQIWCCSCGCCRWVKGRGTWLTARSLKSHVWYVFNSLLMSESVNVALHLPSFYFYMGEKNVIHILISQYLHAVLAGSRSCDPFSASNDVRCCGWSHVHRWTEASQWGEEFIVVPCRPARCFQQVKQCRRSRRNPF